MNDLAQIYTLVERWWDTTNTFHMLFGEMMMTPLDFSLLTGIGFSGWKLELILDIYARLDEVREWLGAVLEDVVVRMKWFHYTFAGKTSFSDDQRTLAFLMYVLGCSLINTRNDRIHPSYLGLLRAIDQISQYDWGNAGLEG